MSCVLKCTIQETNSLQVDKWQEETMVCPVYILSLMLRFPPFCQWKSWQNAYMVETSDKTHLQVCHWWNSLIGPCSSVVSVSFWAFPFRCNSFRRFLVSVWSVRTEVLVSKGEWERETDRADGWKGPVFAPFVQIVCFLSLKMSAPPDNLFW